MALNFPSSPTTGQTYTDDNGVVWEFDSVKWKVTSSTPYRIYSGVKVTFDNDYSLTSSSAAVSFSVEDIDTDAYFTLTSPSRITISRSGFYRINAAIYTGSAGASYTFIIKKNGATSIASSTISTNQFTNYDEVVELQAGDYIELYATETNALGTILQNSYIELTRLGLAIGTFVSSSEAFSGARSILTTTFATTTTSTAVPWANTEFNTNANPAGDLYWVSGANTRLTIGITGYYRVKSIITASSTDSAYIILKKNGSTEIANVNIAVNDTAQLDEIISFSSSDYIELFANGTGSSGSLANNTYLEVTRIGV